MAPRRRRSRPSVVLLAILLSAFAVGAAASVLLGTRSEGPPPVGPTNELLLPAWLVSVIIIGLAIALVLPVILARLYLRGTGGSNGPFAIAGLSLLLAGVIVAVILHTIAGGATGYQTSSGSGNNTTAIMPTANNTTSSGPIPSEPGGVLEQLNLHFPPWIWFLVLVVVLVGIVLVALPPLADYLQDLRENRLYRERTNRATEEVRNALQKAQADLDSALDPRTAILALYATLLARLHPVVTDLDHATPEEIRTQHLIRLGIRAPAAATLTRAFEEARYSSHPLGEDQVRLARVAIREAEDDLTRALGEA